MQYAVTKVGMIAGLVSGLFSLLSATSTQAATLNFMPTSQSVELGSPATLDILISDVESGGLGAFDLKVKYDPTILAFNQAQFGQYLGNTNPDNFSFVDAVSFGSGVINLVQLSSEQSTDLQPIQTGSFTLATLTFDSLQVGISPLEWADVIVGDVSGSRQPTTLNAGSVTVVSPSTVDIPEPIMIVGMLVAIALFGKRRV